MALQRKDRNDRQRGLPFGAPLQKLPALPQTLILPLQEKILFRTQHPEIESILSQSHPPIVARTLAARGHEPGAALDQFLAPKLDRLPDPRSTTHGLLHYERGLSLVAAHVARGSAICIATDFDADGTTAGAQLALFLKEIGAPFKYMVPDRFSEGYGLNTRMVDEAFDAKASLIVVFDMGTKNKKEIEYARAKGIDVFVVDHHVSSDIDCPANVLWNPHQPGCGFAGGNLAATGLAFYLVNGLRRKVPGGDWFDLKKAAQLAAIGTLADMVHLSDTNRIIVSYGLNQLSGEHPLIGLRELLEIMNLRGKTVTSGHISYGIGPRINAAGRMEDASTVLDLLTTDDARVAYIAARTIDRLNKARQEAEENVKLSVLQQLSNGGELPPALIVAAPQLHVGVVGIVAQRLVEAFGRPSIVLTDDGSGGLKGSGRSVDGFNLIESLERAEHLMTKFGGHPRAAGLSLPRANLDLLKKHLEGDAARTLSPRPAPVLTVDTVATLEEMTIAAVRGFEKLAPFGTGNPTPMALVENVTIVEVKEINRGKHLRVTLHDGKTKKYATAYRLNTTRNLVPGTRANIVVTPGYSVSGDDAEVTIRAAIPCEAP